MTPNEGVNLLFAQRIGEDFYGPRVLAAIDPRGTGVNAEMLTSRGIGVLFGRPEDLAAWVSRWRRGHTEITRRRYGGASAFGLADVPADALLLVLVEHAGKLHVIDDHTTIVDGDVIDFVIAGERAEVARAWLDAGSWTEVTPADHAPSDELAVAVAPSGFAAAAARVALVR